MKTKERLKNILIVILLLGAVYMTYATWFYDAPQDSVSFWSMLINPNAAASLIQQSSSERPPLPMAAAINSGGRFGVPYGGDEISLIYEKTGLIMSEAIGTAVARRTATDLEWKNALKGDGVFYDYRATLPLDTLSLWLDASRDTPFKQNARFLFLSIVSEKVLLYTKADDMINVFDTALSPEDTRAALGSVSSNDYLFAFELGGKYEGFIPEYISLTSFPEVKLLSGTDRISSLSVEEINTLLSVFSINGYTASDYSESDGTRVFVGQGATLRFGADGTLTYRPDLPLPLLNSDDSANDTELISSALGYAHAVSEIVGGIATPYFMSIRSQGELRFFDFGQSADAIAIDMPVSGYFLRMTTRAGRIVSIHANLRSYSISESREPLSEALMLAALSEARGDISLRYPDNGVYPLAPEWSIHR